MTNCCDANGNCTQGRNCPIRRQRMEATNKAYAEHGRVVDTDPYEDTLGTVKALLGWLAVALGMWVVFLLLWWK